MIVRASQLHLPTLRDPDLLIYFREDAGGLVMGGYERQSEPAFLPDGTAGLDRIPSDFNGRLLEDDWDRFAEIVENSKRRVPVMDEIKVTRMINGPEVGHGLSCVCSRNAHGDDGRNSG